MPDDEVRLRVTGDASQFVQSVRDGVEEVDQAVASAPIEIPVSTEEAQAAVAALDSKIQAVSADVDDFANRTTYGGGKFGSALSSAAFRARAALDDLQSSIDQMRESGGIVPPEQLSRLDELSAKYEEAVAKSQDLSVTQREVRQSITGTTSAFEDLSVKLDQIKEKVAPDSGLGSLSPIADRATAALDRLTAAADNGGRGVQRYGAVARVALDQVRAAIEQQRASGGPVPPEWEARLKSLEAELESSLAKYGRVKLAILEQQDAMRGAAVQAGAYRGAVGSLHEAVIVEFPEMAQQIFAAMAAMRTFEQSYQGTRRLIEELKTKAGVDIDAVVQETLTASIRILDDVGRAEGIIPTAFDQAKNSAHALGTELGNTGEGIERAGAEWDKFSASLREGFLQAAASEALFLDFLGKIKDSEAPAKLQKDLLGLLSVVDEMARDDRGIMKFYKTTKAALQDLAGTPAFDEFVKQVQRVEEVLDRFGPLIEKGLSGKELEDFRARVATFRKNVVAELDGMPEYAQAKMRQLLEAFGVHTPVEIAKAVKALKDFEVALGPLGSVTKEQADKVVAEARKILAEIALLPKGQRDAEAAITRSLQSTVASYGKFTSEYAKYQDEQAKAAAKTTAEEKKQFEERERNLLKFFQDIDSIAKKDAGGGKDAEALKKSIDAAKSELGGILSKPLLDPQDINRAQELQKQISGLRKDLAALGPSATAGGAGVQRMAQISDSALQSIRDKILDTVANSKAFADTWAKLTPQVQGDLKALVSNFVELLSSGKVTTGQVSDFAEAFARMAGTAGAAGDQMVSKFRAMTDSSQQVKVAFDGLDKGAQTAASGLKTATDASGPAADGMKQVAAAAGQAQNAAAGTGGGYIKLHDATKQLTNAQGELLPNFVAVVNAADKATAGTLSYGGVTADVGKQSEAAAGGIMKVGDQVIRIGGAAKDAQPHIEKTATDTKDLGTNAEKTATSVKDAGTAAKDASAPISQLGEAEKKAGADAHQGAAGIAESGKAAADSVAPTAALVAQLAKLPDLKLPAYWHDIAEGLTDSVKGFQDANVAVGILVATISGDLSKLKDFVIVLKDVRAEARGLRADIAAQNVVMREAVQLCNALTACQKEAAKA